MAVIDTIKSELSTIVNIPKDLWNSIKEGWVGFRKGEAIKIHANPITREEAFAQGYFGVKTNVTLSSIESFEVMDNDLCGIDESDPTCHILSEFSRMIAIGSASTKFRRGESTSQMIQNIKPDFSTQKANIPEPRIYGSEDLDK